MMPSDHTDAMLTKAQGLLLSGIAAASYVVSVYVSQLLVRPQPPLWRNDPQVIKIRSLLAIVSTVLCCLLVFKVIELGSSETASTLLFVFFSQHYNITHLGSLM